MFKSKSVQVNRKGDLVFSNVSLVCSSLCPVSPPLAEGDGAASSAEGGKQMVVHCSEAASLSAAKLTAAAYRSSFKTRLAALSFISTAHRPPFTGGRRNRAPAGRPRAATDRWRVRCGSVGLAAPRQRKWIPTLFSLLVTSASERLLAARYVTV